MSSNVQGAVRRICLALVLIAALSVLVSCGGGGGGGGAPGATAPAAFGLTAPVNNDTGVALSQTLSWESSSGVVTYTMEVTTDSTFGSITTYSSTTIPAGTTSVVVSGLSPSTVYYWRVVAVNTAGSTMASGAPYSFTTVRYTVPLPPVPGAFSLAAPAANAMSIPLSPTLVWGSSSNVSTYTVQVTTDSSFNTITAYENTTVPVGTTSVVVSGLSPSTVYYWRVIAVNAVGSTIASGAPYGFTTKRRGDVQWSATSQPSSFFNNAFGMKINGSSLYIAGYDTAPGDGQFEWRMEKRSLADGGLDAVFGSTTGAVVSNPTTTLKDTAYSVAIDATYLYIAGYDSIPGAADQEWRIEKRDLATGASITSFGSNGAFAQNNSLGFEDKAESIAVNSSPTGTIYAAGYVQRSLTDREWRIEARDKATGLMVTSVTSSLSPGDDSAHAIAIDESEGYMYVVGSDASGGDTKWRIEKRSLAGSLSLETTTFGQSSGTPGYIVDNYVVGDDIPWALALDANDIYIAGEVVDPNTVRQWRVQKRSRTTGALAWERITAFSDDAVANAIAVDGTHVYVAGFDTASGVIEWRIEKRDIVTGLPDSSFGSGGVVIKSFGTPTPLDSNIWAIAVDDAYIYVAGSEGYPNASGSRWRIEKIVK